MKKRIIALLPLVCVAMFFTSCTIKKRIYRPGFFIQWNSTSQNIHQTTLATRTTSAPSLDTVKQEKTIPTESTALISDATPTLPPATVVNESFSRVTTKTLSDTIIPPSAEQIKKNDARVLNQSAKNMHISYTGFIMAMVSWLLLFFPALFIIFFILGLIIGFTARKKSRKLFQAVQAEPEKYSPETILKLKKRVRSSSILAWFPLAFFLLVMLIVIFFFGSV